MDNQDIQKFIGSGNLTISQVMKKIDANGNRILFFVDANQVLFGCVTDGDIRRYLLSGGKMDDKAVNAANRNLKAARSIEEAKSLYHKKDYVVIPVVEENGRVIDLYNGEADTEKKRKALHIPVVINAGGRGTRLDPFTRVLPKPLIPVGELPIIELIMKEYQSYSCDEFHIIVNYKRDLMKAFFSDNERHYNISWYDEEKPLGTGGGLSLLQGKFDSSFFFTNCDVLLKADYESILHFHKSNNNEITMICAYKNLNIPYGVVEIGEDGILESMKEKPQLSFLTNTGIYVVEPEIINDMIKGESIGFPDVIERQRQKGKRVAVYPVSENDWMDMGQVSELEKMRIKLYGE